MTHRFKMNEDGTETLILVYPPATTKRQGSSPTSRPIARRGAHERREIRRVGNARHGGVARAAAAGVGPRRNRRRVGHFLDMLDARLSESDFKAGPAFTVA